MKKRLLVGIGISVILIIVSFLISYYLRTQRQVVQKKAVGEFRTFNFKPADNSYEAIFSYRWEYPKLIWRFDKLTCAIGQTLGQRRFLHIAPNEGEVQRGGWLDQSYLAWNPGEPLPSGEIIVPQDRGCWFQLDVTMSIKPQYGQTSEETNAIIRNERAVIENCSQLVPTATPTNVLPSSTPTQAVSPTITPRPPTATPTRIPSSTPTLTLTPSATGTPVVPTATSVPNPTNTPIVPTATSTPQSVFTPNPTATPVQVAIQPILTEKPLPVSGTILPTLGSFIAGLLLVFVSLAILF